MSNQPTSRRIEESFRPEAEDYFERLGLKPNATLQEIREASDIAYILYEHQRKEDRRMQEAGRALITMKMKEIQRQLDADPEYQRRLRIQNEESEKREKRRRGTAFARETGNYDTKEAPRSADPDDAVSYWLIHDYHLERRSQAAEEAKEDYVFRLEERLGGRR